MGDPLGDGAAMILVALGAQSARTRQLAGPWQWSRWQAPCVA